MTPQHKGRPLQKDRLLKRLPGIKVGLRIGIGLVMPFFIKARLRLGLCSGIGLGMLFLI